ncbi:hypothetical protein [Micromonospora costi]|uniref:Uncharacterized protein n=1 Tax=Micromonospora costi TaxID=1530042 RepID=A0A3A9ZYZ1_9ACTN|nr:hypothetical protein [Micromonospora costi]RKN53748.1 hypothetical protein D7193_16890 [Micromonospora costi]
MPHQIIGRVAVVSALLVGVLALCGLTVQRFIGSASPAEEVECSESDHRLAELLARDPALSSPPPGTTLDRIEQVPCGDDSDPGARYVTADISLPPGTSMDSVLDHYRTLLTAGQWRMVPISDELGDRWCADRVTNGQQIRLLLEYGWHGTPGPHTYGDVQIEISFKPAGEDIGCPR